MNPPCPCCKKPLTTGYKIESREYVAFCQGAKPCTSYAANDGATGRTEFSACDNLIKAMNKKPDWETK